MFRFGRVIALMTNVDSDKLKTTWEEAAFAKVQIGGRRDKW
jgi:hypothetical protein